MPLFTIINPVCGHKSGSSFFDTHVFPRLNDQKITVDYNLRTSSPDDAPNFIREYFTTNRLDHNPPTEITIILGSGDGTLHEIIEAIRPYTTEYHNLLIRFVLIPCGTANALYFSLFPDTIDAAVDTSNPSKRLRSLEEFLAGKEAKTLSLAVTTVSNHNESKTSINTAAVVTSTALHACILRDSESLRDEHPGVERFKVAAQKNSTVWYYSQVKLHPCQSSGKVEIYNPDSNAFSPLESHGGSKEVIMEGPFVYFTATTNVDRLESTFRVLPLMRSLPPPSPTCDIAVVRPLRCSAMKQDTEHFRTEFAAQTWKVLHGAYEDGAHVRYRYEANGEITNEGNGQNVVEYVRCGGWEWIPMEDDPNAHILCCDGEIVSIEQGGTASCAVDFKSKFYIYA
ncbi:hypothetical protein CVT24_003375 [Panaeolus cyanescens]|uniref:DAGKc domain-containing protein n=1 Tax=Panaeolus cyanescens TaxID=181874 RepID=A0A409Y799_9AGAR|nr:hypothetical protein CVT24_003375 [Panaeolus cyanescens]